MVAFSFPGDDGPSATKPAKCKKTFIRLQTPGKRKYEDPEDQASSTPHDLLVYSSEINRAAEFNSPGSQFSSRSKKPIRSGLEISSDILAPNTALRRERAHEVDLAKSRRHRAKLRSADPIAYANRVTADKQAWAQKNSQMVLDIAAKVRITAKESNRFSYDDCDEPFASQFALESHLKTDKHAKRVAKLTVAEQFREEGQDILLFINNIFRFAQAKLSMMDTLSPMLVFSQCLMDDKAEVRPKITLQAIYDTLEKSPVWKDIDSLPDRFLESWAGKYRREG
ncbi:ATP synthase subunit beta mitochondrial [Fusarium mexicanum]|uniref:ATP synthase subunit beta mitochondrial n=1 Tax=Fusarium mexicanum TaxID=751941 RepID=A0A8H5I4X5_9HYPO|nr:ATP synthase subunit beta mitochondrial [Fusarium mexicanum]